MASATIPHDGRRGLNIAWSDAGPSETQSAEASIAGMTAGCIEHQRTTHISRLREPDYFNGQPGPQLGWM